MVWQDLEVFFFPEERINKKKLAEIITSKYPSLVAFFANNRNASLLNVFVDEIKAIGRRKKLKLISYAPSTVKKLICGNGRASKEELARVIVSKYPELKVYLTQDRAWKEKYHQNMFDAVALGMMAQ